MEVDIDTNIDIPMPSVPSVPSVPPVESLKQTAIVVDGEDEEGPLGTTNVCFRNCMF